MSVSAALDNWTDWLWAAFLAVFGWAWRLDRRVTKLEADHTATVNTLAELQTDIRSVDEKLGRLIDKLL